MKINNLICSLWRFPFIYFSVPCYWHSLQRSAYRQSNLVTRQCVWF